MNKHPNKIKHLCVCQSGKVFVQCCDRFLNHKLHAKTPVQLMRSRYSAFTLGGYGDYLLTTWKLGAPSAMPAAELSIKSTEWVGLEIINKSQKGDWGFVEFRAFYLDDTGLRRVHHEKSNFERINGRWLYVNGEVLS